MLFITDNEFERVVSRARNRDIAREYYRRDYVVNVSITIDNRGYYHISGKVMINGNIYLPWEERLCLDREYVDRMSFMLDLRILVKTVAIVLFGEEKYIKKCIKNDREAQLKIYQLFSPVLYGICLK